MKRYRLFPRMVVGFGEDQTFEGRMIECEKGEWVAWNDVKELLKPATVKVELHLSMITDEFVAEIIKRLADHIRSER